ncbi:conserved hypothetical protein [Leishmania infantum JPCM5]|uniref:Uncharacterized protein n=2 Tax=Leishmania infantum TaxID=5671 RepID=A4I3W3_LEIIN|nr:conserved hypothetical protein [Leishmania infantum JPCM5]CAC9504852.1 hypothetical_protein_-_conserved [Leishmania infantum]CAM69470.1 conserved hypothetical protein [Leishmania infantum JPCM5]SUZ43412.1 hypothetical_protein_-_conserved [Leishmania infantum]|eukprot:XP_001470275.1 conserved hypothetical protein [Leishmania infantum JPCM5]
MSRVSLQRRPHSSAPGEVNCAGAPVHPKALHAPPRRRASACSSSAAYFPTQASLFRDSYGLPLTCAAVSSGCSYQSPHRRLHVYANGGGRDVGPRYHDVTCSPGARRPPPPPRRAVTAGASAGRSRAANGSGAADAVVFQYYSQQRQKRGQMRSQSSLHDFEVIATPVRRQSSTSSGGGFSAPATPAGGNVEASSPPLPSRCTSRPPAHDRDAGIHARLHRQPSASPLSMEQESVIHDTSTSLIPLMPPIDEGSWPVQLSPSQHQQCEAMVRLLAQLPAAQAHRVLLAAIRQYEAQRLLQYYGGVHALPGTESSPRAMPRTPSTSSLASSPVKVPSARRHDDGRSALFEALRARLDDMQRADMAAQALSPFTAASSHRQRRGGSRADRPARGQSHVSHFIRASPPTIPPPTAARRPYLARRQTPQDSETRQCPDSGDARAPRQLRSRILASRVGKPRARGAEQGCRTGEKGAAARDASASSQNHSTPLLQQRHDFMKTIKPPHRHGLAGALLVEPGAPHEAAPVTHGHDSGGRASMPPGAQVTAVAGRGEGAREEGLYRPASMAERNDGSLPPPLLAFTVTGKEMPDASVGWPLAEGTALSPGAAAARRAYLEQQQKEQQQRQRPSSLSRLSADADDGEGSELLPESARRSHVTRDESDAACRYPRSSSADCFGPNSGKRGAASPGSVSLEDSAPRSGGLRGSSAPSVTPAPLTGVLAAPPPPKQIPGVHLSTRVATVGSAGEPAVFITDCTGASTSALCDPKARPHDRKGSDDTGTPGAPPFNNGAFWGEDYAAAAVGGSSGLHRQNRYREGGSGADPSTPPLQGKCAEGLDGQNLLSSPAQFEDSVITASSISSEPFLQEQAADNDRDGVIALTAHSASRSAAAGSRAANKSSDELLLPWEI